MRRSTLRWALLWSAFFALYASTTAQGPLPADSGEFQLAAARWGILHPPGYPLYTMVGGLWVHLIPFGNAAWRLNLFSAALAATTLCLLTDTVRRWADDPRRGRWGGLIAALLLATAPTFWAQATTANIRMPTMLFAAAGFRELARYDEALRRGASPSLRPLALVLGLGVGHHPSLLFVATGWALYLLLRHAKAVLRPRPLLQAAAVALPAWLLPQLYIPLRGAMPDVPLAVPELNTWHGFWHHVLARGFAGDMFAFANPADLALRLPLLPALFHLQFPWLGLMGAAAGGALLLRRKARLVAALGLSLAVHTFVTLTYRAPQTVEYLMPAYLPLVLLAGMGAAELPSTPLLRRKAVRGALLLLVAAFCWRAGTNWRDIRLQADDAPLRARLEPLLREAPAEATILADWRWATPLWVLQQVEGLRPDVQVDYVYPVAGRDYESLWRERAEAAEGALFTTHRYDWEGWTFVPWGGGYRLYRRPLTQSPQAPGFHPLEGGLEPLEGVAYRLDGAERPGTTLEIALLWRRVAEAEAAPSFTVRLYAADGHLLAHGDRFIGDEGAVDEVRTATMALRLPMDFCGEAELRLGEYLTTAEGFRDLGEQPLTHLTIPCDFPSLPTAHLRPNLFLDGGPFLRGVDYETDGGQLYLHLCGAGRTLIAESGGTATVLEAPGLLRCRTFALPWDGQAPRFLRADGQAAHLLLPPAAPRPQEHYLPFDDAMVLAALEGDERGGQAVLTLRWLSARPVMEDVAVSVRLHAEDGALIAVHDMQPGLSDLPTLKWVVRGLEITDPHPFPQADLPSGGYTTVAAYERFRLTPLLPPVEGLPLHWR